MEVVKGRRASDHCHNHLAFGISMLAQKLRASDTILRLSRGRDALLSTRDWHTERQLLTIPKAA